LKSERAVSVYEFTPIDLLMKIEDSDATVMDGRVIVDDRVVATIQLATSSAKGKT